MPVKYKDFATFMGEMSNLNAYTPGATTTSSSKKTNSSTKGVGEASYFNAFSGALNDKVALENKKVDNAYEVAQGQLAVEGERLNSSNALERAKLELSKTQSAAQTEAANKANDRAYGLAMGQFHQSKVESARNAANNKAQIANSRTQIDYNNQNTQRQLSNDLTLGKGRLQNERLGIMSAEKQQRMATAAERYGYDMEFKGLTANNQSNERMQRNQLAFNRYDTDSKERLGMRGYDVEDSKIASNERLGMKGYDVEALGINKQFDLGMENIASSERLGMRGYDVEDSRIASNERLGMEGYATQRYGMDKQFELGLDTNRTQRYGMDKQFELGLDTNRTQRYGMDKQYDLGMANVASNERLGMRGYDVKELDINKQFELGLDTNRTNRRIAQLQGAVNLRTNNRSTFAQLIGSFG